MIDKEHELMQNDHRKVMKLRQQQISLNYFNLILTEDGIFNVCMYLGLWLNCHD